MLAWGKGCSTWDDSADYANLEAFDYGEIPEDKFVMTTWLDDESLAEVFRFAANGAFHPNAEPTYTLILHIAALGQRAKLLSAYRKASRPIS